MKKLIYLMSSGIMAALGFSGCDDGIINGGGMVEYGPPHCDFKIDITVTDESGKPLNGIRVTTVKSNDYVDDRLIQDTLYTDENGKVSKEYSLISPPKKYELAFDDVDGEENGGSFESAAGTFEVKKIKKGDGNWYEGVYEASGKKSLKKTK